MSAGGLGFDTPYLQIYFLGFFMGLSFLLLIGYLHRIFFTFQSREESRLPPAVAKPKILLSRFRLARSGNTDNKRALPTVGAFVVR